MLVGRDKDASAFIAHFSGSKDPSLGVVLESAPKSIEEQVYQAIIEGDRDGVLVLIKNVIEQGRSARDLCG